jgi:hypothetical protein
MTVSSDTRAQRAPKGKDRVAPERQFSLESLTIKRFRNLVPGTMLRFNSGKNIILGENASGKTTLLNLISMVLRSNFSEIEDEDFDLGYRLSFEGGSLSAMIASARTDAPVAQQLETSPDEGIPAQRQHRDQPQVKYSFHFDLGDETCLIEGDRASATATFSDKPAIPIAPVSLGGRYGHGPFIALYGIMAEKKEKTRIIKVWDVNSFRFDESLDAFRAMTGSSSRLPGAPCTPPAANLTLQSGPAPAKGVGQPRRIEVEYMGREVLGGFLAALSMSPEKPPIVVDGSKLHFLVEAARLLSFKESSWMPEFSVSKKLDNGGEETHYDRFNFRFKRSDGSVIGQDLLSYGQKRLLAFLYYLDANVTGPVVADEIVNGFHHGWITECLELISRRDRQAFLSSQNPLLFDFLTFSTPEEVRSTFVLCRVKTVGDRVQMQWNQMEPDEASEFFAEYEVGIEHVGAILNRRGLW